MVGKNIGPGGRNVDPLGPLPFARRLQSREDTSVGMDIYIYPERRRHGVWQFSGRIVPNRFYDPHHLESGTALEPESIFDGRSRALFAVLGAPCNAASPAKTHRVIAPPRGLPADCSGEVAGQFQYIADNNPEMAAAASWLTLAELQAFAWYRPQQNGFLWNWWFSENRKHYARSVSTFVDSVVPTLAALGAPNDVRVVYWFSW